MQGWLGVAWVSAGGQQRRVNSRPAKDTCAELRLSMLGRCQLQMLGREGSCGCIGVVGERRQLCADRVESDVQQPS